MGLRINEEKPKYIYTTRTQARDRVGQNVTMDKYNFELVNKFVCLGTEITADNELTEEIK